MCYFTLFETVTYMLLLQIVTQLLNYWYAIGTI